MGEKSIEELSVGEYVYNPLLRSAFRIKNIYREENHDPIYTIQVTSSSPEVKLDLTVTAAHPVVTKAGIKPVALLDENDKILLVNKIPVTSKSDYSWFSVKKLLRTVVPGSVKVYNMDFEPTGIKIEEHAGEFFWTYSISRSDASCQATGCAENFLSSNQIVSGNITKQQDTEKMLQEAFININNSVK